MLKEIILTGNGSHGYTELCKKKMKGTRNDKYMVNIKDYTHTYVYVSTYTFTYIYIHRHNFSLTFVETYH